MTDAAAIFIAAGISGSIAAVPAIIAAIRSVENGKKLDFVSVEVDGKISKLMEQVISLTGELQNAIGNREGQEKERERKK
jgi:hypothetical protein